MAEGSDGSGNEDEEMGGIEVAGEWDGGWSLAGQNNKKKQHNDRVNSVGTDSEENVTPTARQTEEYKVNINNHLVSGTQYI